MRTTLDLDPSVVSELRLRARKERKSMGQVASEALVRLLRSPEAEANVEPLGWVIRDLGVPLVDLEDKERVRRTLDATP